MKFVKTLKLVVVVALAGFTPVAAQAQMGLDLLLLGGLKLADAAIGKHSQSTASPGKIVLDILLDDRTSGDACDEKSLHYWFTTDSTVAAQMSFGDRVVLRVKSFKNGPPPKDLRLYINDAKADQRGVDGDRGRGVLGGYPLVWVRKLQFGANQLKTRFSSNEWTECEVNRIDLKLYYQLRDNEDNLLQVAGAGHLGYPYTPVYTAVIGGQVRAFGSAEEAQAEIDRLNSGMANQVPQGNHGQTGNEQGGQTPSAQQDTTPQQPQGNNGETNQQNEEPGLKITLRGGVFTPSPQLTTEILTARSAKADLDLSKKQMVRKGQQFFLVLEGTESFHVVARHGDDAPTIDKETVKVGRGYRLRVYLTFPNGINDTVVYVNGKPVVEFAMAGDQ